MLVLCVSPRCHATSPTLWPDAQPIAHPVELTDSEREEWPGLEEEMNAATHLAYCPSCSAHNQRANAVEPPAEERTLF